MKKVLLTSTALVMTAGVAAAEMTMSASAKLTYGNFGTGDYRKGYSAPVTGNFALNTTTGAIEKTAAAFDGSDNTAAASAALTGNALAAARTAYAASKAAGGTETAADAAGLAAGLLNHARAAVAPDSAWSSEADLTLQVQAVAET